MRSLTFSGPYNLIAFEVIPALVQAQIMETLSEEVVLSYRPSIAPDRRVRWTIEVPERGELKEKAEKSEDISRQDLGPQMGEEIE